LALHLYRPARISPDRRHRYIPSFRRPTSVPTDPHVQLEPQRSPLCAPGDCGSRRQVGALAVWRQGQRLGALRHQHLWCEADALQAAEGRLRQAQRLCPLGKKLDADIAPTVAQAIRDWAVSHGATHFTHWFQPQTGLTAEKHDAFFTFDENKLPMESFTGEQLIQSEPDASSFPSGGLRATWEARGYTAWNPASPVFIMESAGTKTLCIPSVFIGYNGEALDEVTPLLARRMLGEAIALSPGDKGVQRVYTTLGRAGYFLIDRTHFSLRPDLVSTAPSSGRRRRGSIETTTSVASPSASAYIAEWSTSWLLGVPIVTRHNEVAPCQFEMAPFYEETDIAVDHNQLVMSVLRRVALRHGLQAIVHEKPFAGVNGSGKHCNWAMAITSENELNGINLLKPGKTPHQNIRFLVFLAAVLKGVHKHAGLLRAGIATSGNEHRLGANEAPPAIISVFMGDMLTRVIEEIASGKVAAKSAEQQLISLGVNKLPEIEKDNTDRNRRRLPSPGTSSSSAPWAGQSIAFRSRW
jgi:glutamine synthetase